MSVSRAWRWLCAPIAGVIGVSALTLAEPAASAPLGVEFQLNSYTTGPQFEAVAAVDGAGNFVVVWSSVGQDGDGYGLFGRRFTSSGGPLGVEFQINTRTTSTQRSPDVASDSAGNFVVVWQSAGGDGQIYGVLGQRFNAAGVKQSSEFVVNTHTTGSQNVASVSMDVDGDFVVVWSDGSGQDGDGYGIFGKRFNAAGAAQGGEFQVNVQTVQGQRFPAVALDADGDFVVAWDDGGLADIIARRFSASGLPVGAEFVVNSYTQYSQITASVAIDSDGDFVVVWQSALQDGSDSGIFGRRFDAVGVAQGPDFQVNSYATGGQTSAQVSMSSAGDFVAIWVDAAQDGDSFGVFGSAFNQISAPQGVGSQVVGFQVNSYTVGLQVPGDVAVDADGDFVAVWTSLQDGSSSGIFGRRFSSPISGSIDVDGDGEAEPLTDGILLLRYLFGFRGTTLISGAVAGDCTRCTAPLIEAFLDALGP